MNDQQKPGVDWRAADLRNADLSGQNLEHADLRAATLVGANFTGSTLRYADLRGADFRGANLQLANLQGAYIDGALLEPTRPKLPSPGEIAAHRGDIRDTVGQVAGNDQESFTERLMRSRQKSDQGGEDTTDAYERLRVRSLPAEQKEDTEKGRGR